MRAYVAITPAELEAFLSTGSHTAEEAFIVNQSTFESVDSDSEDQEELEFESSWAAAMESRAKQSKPAALGLVLAVDLEEGQTGATVGNRVTLLASLSWPQVQSLLLAESEEFELSWFATQEVHTYLPQWLA